MTRSSSGTSSAAFIGLGVMGAPMAGHLQNGGVATRVFNRTADKARRWSERHGGSTAGTPEAAVVGADFIFLCVGNDDDVRSVMYGEHGVLAGAKSGATVIDHTTASAELARELANACAQQGVEFMDAPVSGGEAGAVNGQLTVMCGGDTAVYERTEPVMAHYAKSMRLMGAAGAGQLTKMVNQICIAGVLQGLSEGLHFAEAAGLDIEQVVAAISQGAAQSWQMDNRHRTMAAGKFDFGFAVDWMRKDLDIALKTAREINATLPLTALVDQFYADIQGNGGGRLDTSSLITRLRKPDTSGDKQSQ
ncbi:3-hydroxyisobutyrate dehydrogenase [Luminiphilus syltensis NOR5-1B]|uniref:3-hydroxyisobutyrate dehydrogenase n=1 Tax=Luminiphilus syltensis NOR5-1B TaxID=565045 RepID=B8KT03_9GAMM|nr:NAD(P)-dependent oxidoreductase [Luminiphilus syltensis]EED35954.1 3-hydroxyisobutyrate dehydrogenase [Luminiphilus syltensis NOR5-1B]